MSAPDFDVIVIGGGISGLVAAASLAESGLSVLLIEKNRWPGGSCSSFSRRGYRFDTGTSSLSGLGEGGRLGGIFTALGLSLKFLRPAIRETVLGPDFTLPLPAKAEAVQAALIGHFPRDRDGLRRFFDRLHGSTANHPLAPSKTFADLMKSFDLSTEVSLVLEALLGNLGLPAERVHGPTALAFFREYVLDGGYYPAGGMDRLPVALVERLRELGGKIRFEQEVESLMAAGTSIKAVRLEGGEILRASFFVDAAGVRRTGAGTSPALPAHAPWEQAVGSLTPSPSAFMVFVGIDCPLDELTGHRGHILFLPEGSMQEVYGSLRSDALLFSPEKYVYIIVPSRIDAAMAPPGGESLCLFVMAPFRDAPFWETNRERMTAILLARAERIAPGLGQHLQVVESATPLTIGRFTGAYRGATYGWEAIPAQSGAGRLSPVTPWKNLFLAGHWTRPGSGISAVAYSGHTAARLVRRAIGEESRVSRH